MKVLTVTIAKKNTLTFDFNGNSFVKYIPTQEQRKFINDFFKNNKLMFINEEGEEQELKVIIHNTLRNITTIIAGEGINYKDKYAGLPKGTRYIPDKLITFERDQQDWKLDRIKRIFKDYDNGATTEQEFKTEMRSLL